MFDPFSDKNRDKRKCRPKGSVAFDKKQWENRIDSNVRRVLETIDWPEYVRSDTIASGITANPETNLSYDSIKKHLRRSMEVLGYVRMDNPKSKDGKWRFEYFHSFVFRRCGSHVIEKRELIQRVGY